MRRRIIAFIACATMVTVSLCGCKVKYKESPEETSMTAENGETVLPPASHKIKLRYTDDSYTEFFKYCEEEFEKKNGDVDIVLELTDYVDYVENIDSDSTNPDKVPDVCMIENGSLSEVYLAGLAGGIVTDKVDNKTFCQTALNACSAGGFVVAYPLSYSTTFLAYNKQFLNTDNVGDFESLKAYSENADFFSTDEGKIVEKIFGSDMKSINVLYGYVGQGISYGGANGDDYDVVSINNDATRTQTLKLLALIDYFNLSADVTYSTSIAKFLKGKYLSFVATTDSCAKLLKGKIDFGTEEFPDYASQIKTSPLSITTGLFVNPFSGEGNLANELAEFITCECADKLYELSGKLSCKRDAALDSRLNGIYASYEKSTPKNKIFLGEQIYPMLEIALHNIIAGEDVEKELQSVEDFMKSQND